MAANVAPAVGASAAAAPAAVAAWAGFAARAAVATQHTALAAAQLPTADEVAAIYGAGLAEVLVSFVYEQIEATLREMHVAPFWRRLQRRTTGEGLENQLLGALQGLTAAVAAQQEQLAALAQQLIAAVGASDHPPAAAAAAGASRAGDAGALAALLVGLLPRYRTLVGATLQATAPISLTALLQRYYALKLSELGRAVEGAEGAAAAVAGDADTPAAGDRAAAGESESDADSDTPMDGGDQSGAGGPAGGNAKAAAGAGGGSGPALGFLGLPGSAAAESAPSALGLEWCARLRCVASCLVALGLEAASEEAYTAAINRHVAAKLQSMAAGVFDQRVLPAAQRAACQAPLEFLRVVLHTGSGGEAAAGAAAGARWGGGAAGSCIGWVPGPGGWGAAEADEDGVALRLQEWRLRLTYLLFETLGAIRTSDMFDCVVDYPDSAPAIEDLAACLKHTNLASAFARRFGAALRSRLLHAGAATSDIIATYVATIRALHTVDPSGTLLDVVGEPVRAYLRRRPDAIRAIVSLLTEGPSGDGPGGAAAGALGGGLLEEMAAAGARGADGAAAAWSAEGDGDEAAIRLLQGLEGPGAGVGAAAGGAVGAGAGADGGSSGGPDVVALLIGIYGGTGLFLDEYRSMLSSRLLSRGGYDVEGEVRTLEVLKMRFGDAELAAAEVMLRDIGDSKRMDAAIRGLGPPMAAPATPSRRASAARGGSAAAGAGAAATPAAAATAATPAAGGSASPAASPAASASPAAAAAPPPAPLPPGTAEALSRLRATISSHLFWPELQEHELALPPELKAAMEVYAERYHHLKAPRKLQWRPSLGAVTLDVTCGGEPVEFRVTPLHAAILLRFSGADPSTAITAAELASALGAPAPVVRRKALFWVSNGVLAEARTAGGDVAYRRVDVLDPSRIVSTEAPDLSWDDPAAAAAGGADDASSALSEMAPFENYILGILTNFSAVALDRLHNLLRVFVVGEPRYEGRSQEQLGAFLAHLVAAGKVAVDNGVYKRVKAG